MANCNRCGQKIEWAYRKKDGKPYPVNLSGKPHALTCGRSAHELRTIAIDKQQRSKRLRYLIDN